MTAESKRGSNGGTARAEKLSKDDRSRIAREAAQIRWHKKDEPQPVIDPKVTKEIDYLANGIKKSLGTMLAPLASPPIVTLQGDPMPQIYIPAPTQPPEPAKPAKPVQKRRNPIPKAFKGASSYAEKRLAEALKERAEAMNVVAARNAEIPSLVAVIVALGGNPNIGNNAMMTYPQMDNGGYQSSYPPKIGSIAPYSQVDPLESGPGIDPALFQANSGAVPRANTPMPQAEMVPGAAVGGTEELPWVTR